MTNKTEMTICAILAWAAYILIFPLVILAAIEEIWVNRRRKGPEIWDNSYVHP